MISHSPAMVLFVRTVIGRILQVQNQEEFAELNRNFGGDRHFWMILFFDFHLPANTEHQKPQCVANSCKICNQFSIKNFGKFI